MSAYWWTEFSSTPVSKIYNVVFNRKPRKIKKRPDMEITLRNLIRNHRRPGLVHGLQTLVFGILQYKLGILIELPFIGTKHT